MSERIENPDWSLVPPAGWHVREDPDCVACVPSSGEGSLQLSSHRKGGKVSETDLLEFAEHHLRDGAPRRSVELGDFRGFEIAYDTDIEACREWYLRNGVVLLFATWTCELRRAGRLDPKVEASLVTLKVRKTKRARS